MSFLDVPLDPAGIVGFVVGALAVGCCLGGALVMLSAVYRRR